MRYLGLDPGAPGRGGIAVLGYGPPAAWPWPSTDKELLGLLQELGPLPADLELGRETTFALLERPPMMSPGRLAREALTGSFRAARMALVASRISYLEMDAAAWQRAAGLTVKRGLSYQARKARNRAKAQGLFPSLSVDDRIADALLLAWLARRQNSGRGVPERP